LSAKSHICPRKDQAMSPEAKPLTTTLQTGGREVKIAVLDKGFVCEIEVNLPKYELLQINTDNWVLCRPKQLDDPLALVRRHDAARLLTPEELRYWKLWRTLQL
jgi:hypothetical protein